MIKRANKQEADCLAAYTPPFTLSSSPSQPRHCPIILASPHSGRLYPPCFLERSQQPLSKLRLNEDAYIDELFSDCHSLNIPMLAARFPRCFVDVNRRPDEISTAWAKAVGMPHPFSSARANLGLGVVPTRLSEHMDIYKRPLKPSVLKNRLDRIYTPYHTALRQMIEVTREQFGMALLLDCHSMPGFAAMGERRADIVLGDRHGTSCFPETIKMVEKLFCEQGYSVTRNYPYAGGYVTAHYGEPGRGSEVLQIEINRDLYLNPVTYKKKAGFERLRANIATILTQLTRWSSRLPLAAE